MSEQSSEIDRLSAPQEDGGLLVWPAADSLPALIERNRRLRRDNPVELLGRRAPSPEEPPVVMSGHQPEFFHPGVWIKNVAAARLSERVGGRAICLAVDSDASEKLALRWPERRDDRLTIHRSKPPLHGR